MGVGARCDGSDKLMCEILQILVQRFLGGNGIFQKMCILGW